MIGNGNIVHSKNILLENPYCGYARPLATIKTDNHSKNMITKSKKINNQNDFFGPFESKKDLKMILLTTDALYLVSLDFISQLKYHLLPFWENRLQNKPIEYLLKKFEYIELTYSEDFRVLFKRGKYWKHQLKIERPNEIFKLNLLDRKRLNLYFEKFENYLGKDRVSFS